MALTLSRLLRSIGVDSTSSVLVEDVTEDSREVRPGWLFVAIAGTGNDGHDFIPAAIHSGAVAVVADRPLLADAPVIVVSNTRAALADLASAVHENPGTKLRIFGVTGTDGKTTTCFFLASILEAAGCRTGLLTTVETRIGGRRGSNPNRMTTPSASVLQRDLRAMVEAGDTHVVLECSSHALEMERLRQVPLQGAAITNIGVDHIEFHGSREQYARAKWSIQGLLVQGPGRLAINADDPIISELARHNPEPYFRFGWADEAHVRCVENWEAGWGAGARLEWRGERFDISVPAGGRHNLYNALAASALALNAGIPPTVVAEGLARSPMPPGRLQLIDSVEDIKVFVDYAHTEQAFHATLRHLREMADRSNGRLITVFGAAGNRDRAKRPRLGEMAAQLADFFVITNEDPFGEDASAIIEEIAAGAPPGTLGRQWVKESDRRRAIEIALDHARPGDLVVITGKGHEQAIAVGAASIPWSDVEVTRELLAVRTNRSGGKGDGDARG